MVIKKQKVIKKAKMDAQFIISSPSLVLCPPPDPQRIEIALVGRSNVGKSSLLNLLCNRKKLAKTSQTPGKTRLINFFTVGTQWQLVDLPGYGYAKVSKTEQAKWGKMLSDFLIERASLKYVLMLVDGKLGPQPLDLQMAEWLHYHGKPFVTIMTKMDQCKTQKQRQLNWTATNALGGLAVFETSVRERKGVELLWQWLASTV
jgi:GTP-binding protein